MISEDKSDCTSMGSARSNESTISSLWTLQSPAKSLGPQPSKESNYCQMYLNVLLLSDITLPNGKRINAAAFEGDREALHSTRSNHSVNQPRPNDKAWHKWRRCLYLLCLQDSNHTLKDPLGAWIVPPRAYARQWPLLYSWHNDAIYHCTAFDYTIH